MTNIIMPQQIVNMVEDGTVVIVHCPSKLPSGREYTAHIPLFIGYQEPDGFLPPLPEAHALFMYNLLAYDAYHRFTVNQIEYEDADPAHEPNYLSLLNQVCWWYMCEPEKVWKHWSSVQRQCEHINCPLLPDEERYRFNRTPEVVLH